MTVPIMTRVFGGEDGRPDQQEGLAVTPVARQTGWVAECPLTVTSSGL